MRFRRDETVAADPTPTDPSENNVRFSSTRSEPAFNEVPSLLELDDDVDWKEMTEEEGSCLEEHSLNLEIKHEESFSIDVELERQVAEEAEALEKFETCTEDGVFKQGKLQDETTTSAYGAGTRLIKALSNDRIVPGETDTGSVRKISDMLSIFCFLSFLSLANALFFGCGCSSCACASSSYGYGGGGYGYSGYSNYQPSHASYASSYPSGSYFSPYGPGQISGYILRPVGPIQSGGYAVPGGYSGGQGIPVVHQKFGQIGFVQTPYGTPTNGPHYWQPSPGAPYERVLVGGARLRFL